MACNVFGSPITNSTLERLPEYTDQTITRADRATVAYNMKNAENKDVAARRYVDELVKPWGDDSKSVLCLVYNATGNTITYVRDFDWDGHIAQAPYPVEIANGQWGAFLHKMGEGGSCGGIVYRIEGDNSGDDLDWMFSWDDNPRWGNNKAYTEVRGAGHFNEDSTWVLVRGYMNDAGRVYTEKNMGYKATVCIGQAKSSIFEAIISADTISKDIYRTNGPLHHYLLVFTWAPSFRILNPGECRAGLDEQFYLHGLWPKDANGEDPRPARRDDPTQAINDLEHELRALWPSMLVRWHDRDFWRHEWNIHGRYGRLDPEDYFLRAINFARDRTRFRRYLHNAGIDPHLTTQWPKADIDDAITVGEGRPNDHIDISAPRNLLYQILIWLDANLNYISCPNIPWGNCIYPPSPAAAAADDVDTDADAENSSTA